MSLAGELQNILQELLISDDDRSKYTEDAVEIQNHVIEKLKLADKNFRTAFDGLSLAGSYLDRVKLKTPDEFDLHMKLKFPFPITPIEDEKGFMFLHANYANHPIVTNNYIDRENLQNWLRDAFNTVFNSKQIVCCKTEEEYELMYTAQGYGCAHTIKAEGKNRNISFDLVPAFEFTWDQWPLPKNNIYCSRKKKIRNFSWLAVPQSKKGSRDERTFMVCFPHWERQITKDLDNFKNVLRLMKGLRDAHEPDLPHLSSYMLKTVLLPRLGNTAWNRDLPTLFILMWKALDVCLRNGELNFFLAKGHNIFDRMSHGQLDTCSRTASNLLSKLRHAKKSGNHKEIAKLFNVSN